MASLSLNKYTSTTPPNKSKTSSPKKTKSSGPKIPTFTSQFFRRRKPGKSAPTPPKRNKSLGKPKSTRTLADKLKPRQDMQAKKTVSPRTKKGADRGQRQGLTNLDVLTTQGIAPILGDLDLSNLPQTGLFGAIQQSSSQLFKDKAPGERVPAAGSDSSQEFLKFGGGGYVSSTPGAQIAAGEATATSKASQWLRGAEQTAGAIYGGFDPQAGEAFQGAVEMITSGNITGGYAQLPNYMSADMATLIGLPTEWYTQLYNANGTLKPLSDLTGGGFGGGSGGGFGGFGGFGGGGGGRRADGLIGRPWRYGLIQWRL